MTENSNAATTSTADPTEHDGRFDVVVIGAGLAGLTAAATATRAGRRTAVLSLGALGGRAATTERDGYRFNQGAHALYVGGPGMAVLNQLGIEPTGGPPDIARAHTIYDGELQALPVGPVKLATAGWLSVRSRAQLAAFYARLGKWDLDELAHRSTAEWVASLELRPDAEALLGTFIRLSTYADDPTVLSADTVVHQLSQNGGVRYLDRGWQQLVGALIERGVTPHHGRALGLQPVGEGWQVEVENGALLADAVVLAAGGPQACRSLLPGDPGWAEVGPAATAACLDLGLKRVPSPPLIFGADEPLYLSTHCPPADLAPSGGTVAQLMRYGARSAELDRPALRALAERAGIAHDDVVTERFLAHMVTCSAVPTPKSGGMAGRPGTADSGQPGVFLAGDWVGPHGHLADASLASGQAAGLAASAHAAHAAPAPTLGR